MAELARGEEDQRGKIPYFNTIPLDQLVDECNNATKAGKYHYIADLSGKAQQFFSYQA